ncbi:hypothetical protein CCHL11_09626 [Colletotrichum chlorophyti]|uniref:Tat pathway signal sequence n=1 Tax=Colletotrichum chlorophyti TaxID=708187 RepID=A0A1Q8S8G3_9PEZI|nr:hypothetical protein CCHL11_09626 [Colletotrichum chlorophyti]
MADDDGEDEETRLSFDDENQAMLSRTMKKHASTKLLSYVFFACNIFLFLFSAAALLVVVDRKHCITTRPNGLLKAINSYSPLLDVIDIPFFTAVVNVSVSEVMSSAYTGSPSRDMDAKWDLLGNLDPVAITADEVISLGKNPSTTARWPESFGLGSDAYIAAPNALHHLHCLDWIRRDLNSDHPEHDGGRFQNAKRSTLHRFHTQHCLYVLMKQLTCHPSTTMFVFEWVEGNPSPFPDFSVKETCVNYDAILRWHNTSSRPRKDMLALKAPEGQQKLPVPNDIKSVMELLADASGER